MAIPTTPNVADRPPWKNVSPIRGTSVQLMSNQTNTATSATQITGLTNTFVVTGGTIALKVYLSADSVSNSGANNVILTLWSGTVGTGTQLGQDSSTAQSGALADVNVVFYVPISALTIGSSVTLNIGMHGSGAGTNTMVGSTTAPISFWVEAA